MLIQRGLAALERAESLGGALGPFALQAAIAACHARARTADETDWERIASLYQALAQVTPSPIVELNRAVAISMAYGPAAGLELVDTLTSEPTLAQLSSVAERAWGFPEEAGSVRGGARRARAGGVAHAKRARARAAAGARPGVRGECAIVRKVG